MLIVAFIHAHAVLAANAQKSFGTFGLGFDEHAFENAGSSGSKLGLTATASEGRLQRAASRRLDQPDAHVAVDGDLDGGSRRLGGKRHFQTPFGTKYSTKWWFWVFLPPGLVSWYSCLCFG